MNPDTLRKHLLRALREGSDGAKITVHLKNGQRLHGRVTLDHSPQSWDANELIITQQRTTETQEHIIAIPEIAAITVIR